MWSVIGGFGGLGGNLGWVHGLGIGARLMEVVLCLGGCIAATAGHVACGAVM